MKRYYILLPFIFYWIFGRAVAQVPALHPATTTAATAWEQAGEAVVLLRNEGGLLPVKRVNGGRLWLHHFGMEPGSEFDRTIRCYREPAHRPKLAGKADMRLSAIDAAVLMAADTAEVREFQRVLRYDMEQSPVVLVVFGDPGLLLTLPELSRAQALIWAPGRESVYQSMAAQLIFGGCAAGGKLPISIGELFPAGAGLATQEALRLGYAPAETVGLDGGLLKDSIAAIVEQGIRQRAFPGAQVLVAKDGKIVYHEAFGHHTYDSLQAVNTTDIYDFASVTKVTSALPALMKLHGEGRFNLDAPLSAYLPYFCKGALGKVTCRELLAHYGGLQPSIVFWREAKDAKGGWKKRSFRDAYSRRYPIRITDSLFLHKKYKKKIFKGIRELPLLEKKAYVYSDLSFILYPDIVERLTGEPLEVYLKKTFYAPLGAATLTFNPLRHFPQQRIVPTERDTFFRKMQVHGTVHDETAAMLGGVSGHAGLFGSAGDLAKLVQLYLNGGEYGGERLIERAAVEAFTRCQYCGEGNRRGLGFDKPPLQYDPEESYVAASASPASFGHSGYTGTFFWADPEYDLLVIFFSNRVYPDRSSVGLYDLNIRPRIQQVVYDAMEK
jgi:CubicO group peptidase (beta-lactamase class C family)